MSMTAITVIALSKGNFSGQKNVSVSDAHVITDSVLRHQVENHPRAQELLRAFLYPYAAPDHDFLFDKGAIKPLSDPCMGDCVRGRVPVLAVGSNRAPRQLARKFAAPNDDDAVPVTFGWMADHDIVYSAHITGYGALPATLAKSPGTSVRVAVTWLTARQLSHMHVTESVPDHYLYRQVDGGKIDLDCGLGLLAVGAYVSVAGYVFDEASVFALAAVPGRQRRFVAREQWEMTRFIAQRAGQVMHPDFLMRLLDDANLRQRIVKRHHGETF